MATSKLQTLRSSQQFRRVYEQGHRVHTPFFSAFILGTGSGERRYGITVTRKIGNAVIRNRCKRRLREVIQGYKPDGSNLGGFDLVINVKAGLAEADFKELQEAFSQVMESFRNLVRKQTIEAAHLEAI